MPPSLSPAQTVTYKQVDQAYLSADVYLPELQPTSHEYPLFLFLHGGGWIGGSRSEISRPLLHELLSQGFVVTSADYRLLPEATLKQQFDDVRATEHWVRSKLPELLAAQGMNIRKDAVIVGGASAGGHLAMMVVSVQNHVRLLSSPSH